MKKIKLKKRTQENQSSYKGYKIDYKKELNQEQYDAIMHNNGPALVIAGAGTGKTRTLTYRVARLIEDGVPPSSILLLTFTRKAASEMINRATSILDNRAERISGGTFHSFALNILRRYSEAINYAKDFNVLDQSDSTDTIDLIRVNYLPPKMKRRFPKKNTIQKIYSLSINKRESVNEILEEYYPKYLKYEDDINNIIIDYHKYKRNANLMDYDDLLVNLLRLLKDNKDIHDRLNKAYKYIMVDEYQDTNRIQHEIVLNLGGKQNNIMAVGDDAQSIYSFRGADYQNIFFFPESFDECKKFKIEQNYRSTEQILNLTNKLINDAEFKYEKKLFTEDRIGDKPYLVAAKREREQSDFLIQQILEHRENGVPLEEIAVLFRSGFHSFDLEIELNRANIPFMKFGGMKFIETAHIKDLLAYVKITFNPRDVVSWQRVLLLIENIGPVSVKKIIDKISTGELDLTNYKKKLPNIQNKEDVLELFKMVSDLHEENDIAEIIVEFSYLYKKYIELKYDDMLKRWRDIETFIQIAEQYSDITEFLNDMALDPPVNSLSDLEGESKEDEFITLSTIHSAKGLEWKIVFIIWATEGKFPNAKSVHTIDSIEEERRLFYVAATRAKDFLYIVYPFGIFDRESGMVLSEPSRFVREIDEEFIDKYILEESDDSDLDSDD